MQLLVKVDSAQVERQLVAIAAALANTAPAMSAVGQALETNARRRFDTKLDPAGNAWAPYKAVSAAIYRAIHKKDPPGTLLHRSGNMRSGIEHHLIEGGVEVGMTAQAYAPYHELGTKGRGKKGGGAIPRRGVMFGAVSGVGQSARVTQVLGQQDEDDVLRLLRAHIEQATRR